MAAHTKPDEAVTISKLSDREFQRLFTTELRVRRMFTAVSDTVEALLTLEHGLAEHRRADLIEQTSRRNRIIADAQSSILTHEMRDSAQVADLVGTPGSGRSAAQRLREKSAIIGLKVGNKYLHPAFQFDTERRQVRPLVEKINTLFDAGTDPWAAASWWLSPNGWLAPGVSPADLVADADEQTEELLFNIAEGLYRD